MPTATLSAPRPEGYDDRDEGPAAEFPDVPGWTENYCFIAYDPNAELALWLHLSRQQFDLSLWREVSVIYLPSGERVLTKNYGRDETAAGPGGGTLSLRCEEPWNRWMTRLSGAGTRVRNEWLWGESARDVMHVPASYELTWQSLTPVWDMGAQMREQTWGHTHYEQLCRVTGPIVIDGERLTFDGIGIRDHTRGPRDYQDALRHIWASGVFPSGKAFMTIDVVVRENRISRAVLFDGERLTEVEVVDPPMLVSPDGWNDPYRLTLGDARIAGEITHNMPYGLDGSNDVLLGYDPRRSTHCLFEGMGRFEWDGEVGFGHTERLLKIDTDEEER